MEKTVTIEKGKIHEVAIELLAEKQVCTALIDVFALFAQKIEDRLFVEEEK